MQYTASPKGSWDSYCKDLIDWCLRQDSPSPLTLSLALLLFFPLIYSHVHTHKVKLGLRELLLAVEVIKKTYNSL